MTTTTHLQTQILTLEAEYKVTHEEDILEQIEILREELYMIENN